MLDRAIYMEYNVAALYLSRAQVCNIIYNKDYLARKDLQAHPY